MLRLGIRTFHQYERAMIDRTALRRLGASAAPEKRRNFVVSFGGYSVTVGRGNLFCQSSPFVVRRILGELVNDLLGVDLIARNAAIGGIPSFPFGWCLPNFLGEDSDLVSWDYGMNEGNRDQGLEGCVRHAMTSPKSPMIIVLDNKGPRMDLLQRYVQGGALEDTFTVKRGEGLSSPTLMSLPEEAKPEGLREWDLWGAPLGSPGQSSWHPRLKEHGQIGWMVAMHLLIVVERLGGDYREQTGLEEEGELLKHNKDNCAGEHTPFLLVTLSVQRQVHYAEYLMDS